VQQNLTNNDIYHLKENIYNIDFWLAQKMYAALAEKNINLQKYYSDQVILGICANCRETLFGIVLFIKFMSEEEKK